MDTYKYVKYGLLLLIVYGSFAFFAWVSLMDEKNNGIKISKEGLHQIIKDLCKKTDNPENDRISALVREDLHIGVDENLRRADDENLRSAEKGNLEIGDKDNLKQRNVPDSKDKDPPKIPFSNLVLSSTWGMKKGKAHIRKSILLNWRKWYPRITPVLFVDRPEVVEEARSYKWHLQNVTETSCGDSRIPTLRGMFQKIMSDFGEKTSLFGFCNGDLLFDDGLEKTISALLKSEREIIRTRPVLILVKRINVRVDDNAMVTNLSFVQKLAKSGRYPGEGSSDVFIANKLFPWKKVPELVVGRIGFGMWMVAFARANNVTTYDLTKTVTAVHMTDSYGNHESSKVSNEWCNHQLVNSRRQRPKHYRCGYIDCSSKRSEYDKENNIVFNDVTTLDPGCSLCKNDTRY